MSTSCNATLKASATPALMSVDPLIDSYLWRHAKLPLPLASLGTANKASSNLWANYSPSSAMDAHPPPLAASPPKPSHLAAPGDSSAFAAIPDSLPDLYRLTRAFIDLSGAVQSEQQLPLIDSAFVSVDLVHELVEFDEFVSVSGLSRVHNNFASFRRLVETYPDTAASRIQRALTLFVRCKQEERAMDELGYWCLCGKQMVCETCEHLSCSQCTCTCNFHSLQAHIVDLQMA